MCRTQQYLVTTFIFNHHTRVSYNTFGVNDLKLDTERIRYSDKVCHVICQIKQNIGMSSYDLLIGKITHLCL